jgi:deoxyribonuclease (pyrimidine dimer)
MTRINVVSVDELTDGFIIAEYFELPRVFLLVRKHQLNGKQASQMTIPPAYTYGEGHVRFFYDKLRFLWLRHQALEIEGCKRNLVMRIDPIVEAREMELHWFIDTPWWGDYQPTPEAIQLNLDRLQLRRRYDGGVYLPYQGSR